MKKNNWLINAFFLATTFLPLTLHSEDTVIMKTELNKDVLMITSLKLHQSKNKQPVSDFMLMMQWEICLFERPSVIFRHLYEILWCIAKLL